MEDELPSVKRIDTREGLESRLQAIITAAEAGGLDVRGAYACTAEECLYDVEITHVVPPSP